MVPLGPAKTLVKSCQPVPIRWPWPWKVQPGVPLLLRSRYHVRSPETVALAGVAVAPASRLSAIADVARRMAMARTAPPYGDGVGTIRDERRHGPAMRHRAMARVKPIKEGRSRCVRVSSALRGRDCLCVATRTLALHGGLSVESCVQSRRRRRRRRG